MLFSTTFQRLLEFDKQGNIDFIHTPYIPPATHSIWDEIIRVIVILKSTWGKNAVMLNGSSGRIHPDVLAIVLMNFVPRKKRPLVALVGEMWQPNPGIRGLFEGLIIKFADRVIGLYVVHSTDELEVFPEKWKIDRKKVKYCAYFASIADHDLERKSDYDIKGHIFAGGNSLRDYEPLIEVARRFPDRQFIIASGLLNGREDLPQNLRVGQVSHVEFIDLLKTASVVVVSIMRGLSRAAGQQTYLNAMLLGKPTVVTDGLGVRDHIKDRETGLIVSGSVDEYVDSLDWLFAKENEPEVLRMTELARNLVREKYTKKIHVARLIQLMISFIDESDLKPSRSLK